MTVTPPETLAYGKVVGRFLLSVADTADDPDREPDAKGAEGLRVTFTPRTRLHRLTDESAPVTVLQDAVTCVVGADGAMKDPAGADGVWLVTGVYTVTYGKGTSAALRTITLPSTHTIEVTAEHTDEAPLDLTTALPYTPPAGVTVQTVQLPTGASAGKVLGWTASGAAWVTPEDAGAHTHEPEEVTGLAAVASSGSYNDLTDTPSIPATASDVGAADAEHTHPAEDITGLATVATSGDYDDLENKPSIPSTPGDIGAAAASHQHAAGDISSGTLDVARVPDLPASKVTSGTFDEARIPPLPGSKITSGTIAPARLGSGTADSTKFLRGDGTWQTPPSGGGGVTDHGALTGLGDDDHPQYHNDARGDARYYTKTQVDDALSGKSNTGHTHSTDDITGLADVATSGSYDDLDDKPSIPSPPGSGEVTKAQGQFLNGTTDGLGVTSQSDRVKAEWRDGICIVHIDIKHPSGTVGAAVTFTGTDMPAPPNLVETSIGPGTAWIHAGTKIVEVDLPANQRMNGNLIYFYEV